MQTTFYGTNFSNQNFHRKTINFGQIKSYSVRVRENKEKEKDKKESIIKQIGVPLSLIANLGLGINSCNQQQQINNLQTNINESKQLINNNAQFAKNLESSSLNQIARTISEIGPSTVGIANLEINESGASSYSEGSGIIVKEKTTGDLLVITNQHVIETSSAKDKKKNKSDLIIYFYNEKNAAVDETACAEVVVADKDYDLAVLRISSDKKIPDFVKPLTKFRNPAEKDFKRGEFTIAMGSPNFVKNTATMGIISNKNILLDEIPKINFIQTDAAINPGNSGGPLVDQNGYLIGINNRILKDAQGMNLAISIESIAKFLKENNIQLEGIMPIQRSALNQSTRIAN